MTAKKNNYLLYLVATTFFMETLDSTVIATALPMMAIDFQVFAVDVGVGITAYLLTLAVMIPISGWLADRFGARRIFTLAIAIFTGASILCGISESLNFFIEDKNKTVIAIAHRLSTLKHMDRIVVLDKGAIIEQGTHDQLISNEHSLYKKLWDYQEI